MQQFTSWFISATKFLAVFLPYFQQKPLLILKATYDVRQKFASTLFSQNLFPLLRGYHHHKILYFKAILKRKKSEEKQKNKCNLPLNVFEISRFKQKMKFAKSLQQKPKSANVEHYVKNSFIPSKLKLLDKLFLFFIETLI